MEITESIVNYLKKVNKPVSTNDICRAIKRPWHSVQNRLLELKLDNAVKSHKLNRVHVWELKKLENEEQIEEINEYKKPEHMEQISKDRRKAKDTIERAAHPLKELRKKEYIWTGVKGFDKLLHFGIPKGNALIVAGGTGSGKTILALQIMHNALKNGEKCLFITLEEAEQKLADHMSDFGWDARKYISNGQLMVYRINPFDIKRSVDALLAQAKGELLIEVKPVILPTNFKPDRIFVDSLTAIAAAFSGKDETYRIYIEQFFRYLEETGATSFLITETDQIPTKYSPTGTEEFLSDGVIVLYSVKTKKERLRAIEILKLRGAGHERKIVIFNIKNKVGITIHPDKEIFIDV